MKKISDFVGCALKLNGDGDIQYCLWVDSNGGLYVQLELNEKAGTFSDLLFSVSKYHAIRNSDTSLGKPEGYDIEAKAFRNSRNENDSAFLKAALRHLLPED